jgi:hypothetical protein
MDRIECTYLSLRVVVVIGETEMAAVIGLTFASVTFSLTRDRFLCLENQFLILKLNPSNRDSQVDEW